VPRTLVDVLRSGVAEEWVRQAVQQALARGLVSAAALHTAAQQRGGYIVAVIQSALEESNAL